MNLDICKKCLSYNNLSVRVHCDMDYNGGDSKTWVFYARISGKWYFPFCRVECGFYLDTKFLDERLLWSYHSSDNYMLKKDMLDDFFNLCESSCVERMGGKSGITECFYSLEHQLYDWNVKK